MKKVVILGGTGFIGSFLSNFLKDKGYAITIISRSDIKNKNGIDYLQWDGKNLQPLSEELKDFDVFINLSGKSVSVKHTDKNKQKILSSRINTTSAVGSLLSKYSDGKKRLWINASGDAIYPETSGAPSTEETKEIANTFLADVVKKWEAEVDQYSQENLYKVKLRTSVVLGNGGAFEPLKMMTKFGAGGKQGDGEQIMSWIHILDYSRIVDFVIENDITGVINCSSPNPVKNKYFMSVMRDVFKPIISVPTPTFFWNISSVFAPVETSLILASTNVISSRLIELGYSYKYPDLRQAILNIKKS